MTKKRASTPHGVAAQGLTASRPRAKCRESLSAVRDFTEIVLQVETATRRARGRRLMRSASGATFQVSAKKCLPAPSVTRCQ